MFRAHAMARPYSDDLRRKLLEAFDQGKGSLSELAGRFGVSLGWAWKVSAARKRTGRMERPGYRPGAKRRIDEQALAGILRSHPDATLVELQAELENKNGLRFSTQHLWRVSAVPAAWSGEGAFGMGAGLRHAQCAQAIPSMHGMK